MSNVNINKMEIIARGEIEYQVWSKYALELEKLRSQVVVLNAATKHHEGDDDFIYHLADCISDINVKLNQLVDNFQNLNTIHYNDNVPERR